MANGQCLCYSGFEGSSCSNALNISEKIEGGALQQFTTIKDMTSQCNGNKGDWNTKVGYCLCDVGNYGLTCQN